MLGRLSMTVSDAIKEYRFFNKEILSRGKKLFGKGRFKATIFEEVVKQIVKRHSAYGDKLRLVDRRVEQNGCKTYVERFTRRAVAIFCTETDVVPVSSSPVRHSKVILDNIGH
jgi:hypothetical protein